MLPLSDSRREALRVQARRFLSGRTRPSDGQIRDRPAARQAVADLADAGVLQHCVPARLGGADTRVQPLSLVVIREELAAADGFLDAMFAVQGLAAYPLGLAGHPEIQQQWLPALSRGQAIGAFAATEPDAGSDLAAMATVARPIARTEGGGYVIDGVKTFISNAGVADVYVVFARLDDESGHGGDGPTGRPRLAAFAVPADSPGLVVTPVDMAAAHIIGTVRLREVRVPAEARLGAEEAPGRPATSGDGLALCLATLQVFRPTVGAAACGMARRALDETLRRVAARKQFGKPLAAQQSVRFTLAEMATDLQSARLMVYQAAWQQEQQDAGLCATAASMAKLHATETAQRIIDRAVQLHGAAGLVNGTVVQSLYANVRALRIYEGTSEIQKLLIARGLLAGEDSP